MITLKASSLFSKGGFVDGDVFKDIGDFVSYWDDLWQRVWQDHSLDVDHLLLALFIDTRMTPLLPVDIAIEYHVSSHNPIRSYNYRLTEVVKNVEIVLTQKDIEEGAKIITSIIGHVDKSDAKLLIMKIPTPTLVHIVNTRLKTKAIISEET